MNVLTKTTAHANSIRSCSFIILVLSQQLYALYYIIHVED